MERTPGGLDAAPLARFAWRPDYTAVDLQACHSEWQALAEPQLVFEFDFNHPDPLAAFQPAERELVFEAVAAGTLNAVAFWFDLQLDQLTQLSTNPWQEGKGPTWQQVHDGC